VISSTTDSSIMTQGVLAFFEFLLNLSFVLLIAYFFGFSISSVDFSDFSFEASLGVNGHKLFLLKFVSLLSRIEFFHSSYSV